MKIQVQQRGGFAGIAQTLVDIDSAGINPAQAAQLETLARKVESFASKHAGDDSVMGADYVTYDITLGEGLSSRTVTLVDDDSPEMAQVRVMLNQLSALSQGVH